MLVRFFLRRPGRPSMPNMGEEIEDGLGSMLSTAMVSVKNREIERGRKTKNKKETETLRHAGQQIGKHSKKQAVKTRMVC